MNNIVIMHPKLLEKIKKDNYLLKQLYLQNPKKYQKELSYLYLKRKLKKSKRGKK